MAELDQEILASTTWGPHESRLQVWHKLCSKWEVNAFPLDHTNIRAVGASLKWGRYRSAERYYSAAATFQSRRLHCAVPAHLRASIRDCIRSIRRGLGPAELKDSFDLMQLGPSVREGSEFQAFSWDCLAAAADAVLVAAYFCMREIEVASASAKHLYFQQGQLHMLLPAHKSSSQGELTTRALHCGCAVQRQPMCPWHAGARHLQRLEILQGVLDKPNTPLFPADDGSALSKAEMIAATRKTLKSAGVQTTRPDESGQQVERFNGHVLGVAGTQHLYLLGLRFDMVQLHGRWSSLAVQRYLQQAPLLMVPSAVARGLASGVPAERGSRPGGTWSGHLQPRRANSSRRKPPSHACRLATLRSCRLCAYSSPTLRLGRSRSRRWW